MMKRLWKAVRRFLCNHELKLDNGEGILEKGWQPLFICTKCGRREGM
jgi:hypothetical protein